MKRQFSHRLSSLIIITLALSFVSFMTLSCERANSDNNEDQPKAHFPQTRAEIEESVNLSYEISGKIFRINDSLSKIGNKSPKEMVRLYGKIPGVKLVGINEEETTIVVMQEDSVTMHIFLDEDSGSKFSSDSDIRKASSITTETSLLSVDKEDQVTTKGDHLSESIHHLSQGKALFLIPAYNMEDIEGDPMIQNVIEELKLNYDQVDVYEDVRADITKFTGDYLSNYDLVVINAHGSFGYLSMNGEENEENKEYGNQLGQVINGVWYLTYGKKHPRYYCLQTNTRYTPEWAEYLINEKKLTWEQVGIFLDDQGGLCFYVTSETLEGASLDETSVLMLCCSSAKLGRYSQGSMMGSFLKAGGLLYLGFESILSFTRGYGSAYTILKAMRHGLSFQDAADYARDISYFTQSEEAILKASEVNGGDENKIEQLRQAVGSQLVYEHFSSINKTLQGYVSPFPIITDICTRDEIMNISWECNLKPFSLDILYAKSQPDWSYVKTEAHLSHSVEYDLYVDDNLITEGGIAYKTFSLDATGAGSHSCYVIARVMSSEDEQPIATYKSEIEQFTVESSANVNTSQAENITPTSASMQVSYTSNAKVVEQGVVISSTNATPTNGGKDCKSFTSSTLQSPFTVNLSSLTPETSYYARGYVSVEDGNACSIFYGNTVSFTTGKEAKPQISVSPSSFTFEKTEVGKRTNSSVRIYNTGNAVLTITSRDVPEHFKMASAVGSINPGEYKDVNVGFAPTSEGHHKGNIVIHSDAVNDGALKISVSGEGISAKKPNISVSPSSIDFDTIEPGTRTTKDLSIKNTGDATLVISSIEVSSPFVHKLSGFPYSIESGQSISFKVGYEPKSEGSHSGELVIKSNASNEQSFSVNLSGKAVSKSEPKISVSPSSFTFEKTEVGKRTNSSVRIYNTGNAVLTITSRDVPEHFKMASATGTINPGEYKDVNVGFAPTSPGYHEGTIVIHSDAVNNSAIKIPVSGEGVSTKKPKISVNQTHFYFKSPASIPSDPQTLEITNTGEADLIITNAKTVFTYFSISHLRGVTIKPGCSEKLSIVFQMEYPDVVGDCYHIYSNDPEVPVLDVELSGEAYPVPIINVPGSIGFGSFETMKTIKITIKNTGSEKLNISSISSSGVSNVYFSESSISIDRYSYEDIYISVQPTSTGSFTGKITFKSNSIVEPVKTISISGKRTGVSSTVANGHDYVDLGLSVKWADRNVGAKYPQDQGDLFAYGETKTKTSYTQENYSFKATSENYETVTLALSNDAVRANWGGTWRIPSNIELYELVTFCKWTFRELNGKKGYDVVSMVPGYKGNSIFIPLRALILSSEYYKDSGSTNPMVLCIEKSEDYDIFGIGASWSRPELGMPFRGVTK